MSSNPSHRKPTLSVSKGDERYLYEGGEDEEHVQGDEGDDSESEGDEFDDGMDADCPLCLEEMDEGDQLFKPCPCGYQVFIVCLCVAILNFWIDLSVLLAQDSGGGE